MEPYGIELILDLHECNRACFTHYSIDKMLERLCAAIGMKREDLYFWDDEGVPEEQRQKNPKTKGTSAVQFILTSSIVIHTLDEIGAVYVNVFSCKPFDTRAATELIAKWFGAGKQWSTAIARR